MKKTITVNIAGFAFTIEETAHDKLAKYLSKIKSNFADAAERDEIMEDIEFRIAELFHEKLINTREVIIESDISEIIETLGHPEDFASDEDQKQHIDDTTTYINKRLFRDRDNGQIAGVCAGFGHYFSVDPLIFRVLFILFMVLFGTGILLYIILILIIPEAKTTSEKLEMKGRSINVDTIKEHLSGIKNAVSESANNSKLKHRLNDGINKGVEVGKSIFESVGKIIGIAFIILGVFILTFLLLFYFGNIEIIPFIGPDRIEDLPTLISLLYPENSPSKLIFFAIIIASIIPVIYLIIAGIKLAVTNAKNFKQIIWSLAIIWTITICFLAVVSIQLGTDFKVGKTIVSVHEINESIETLHVDVINDDQFSNHIDPYDDWSNAELIKANENSIYFGFTSLEIVPVDTNQTLRYKLKKTSRGSTEQDAIQNIEHIDYPVKVSGNKLFLPPYFSYPIEDKIRGQYVRLILYVPQNKKIIFGDNIDRVWRRSVYDDFDESYETTYTIKTDDKTIIFED